jgi:hypothetical protein
MAQSTIIPYEKYTTVTKFLVQYIQDQNLGPEGGIPAKALAQSCMEHFCGPDGDAVTTKKEIADSIRKMHKEKVLKAVNVNGATALRLHPFNVKGKSNCIENATAGPSRSSEDKENERIEFPGLSQLTQVERAYSPEPAPADNEDTRSILPRSRERHPLTMLDRTFRSIHRDDERSYASCACSIGRHCRNTE